MFLPMYFGSANVVMTHITPKILNIPTHSIKNGLITGAISGLVLSIIGRYGFKVSRQIFPGLYPENVHGNFLVLLLLEKFQKFLVSNLMSKSAKR